MKNIKIITVGRLKSSHWKSATDHYKKRLSHSLDLEEISVKDADSSLPVLERKEQEGGRLLKLLRPGDTLTCLHETGKMLDSREFAAFLSRIFDHGRRPCFMVGGAYGFSDVVLKAANHTLSLSKMTFPHELARVLLYEQLYRAENILAGTGYHH